MGFELNYERYEALAHAGDQRAVLTLQRFSEAGDRKASRILQDLQKTQKPEPQKTTPPVAIREPRQIRFTIPAMPWQTLHQLPGGGFKPVTSRVLVGYYTKGKAFSANPRAKQYDAWKEHVRAHLPEVLAQGVYANTRDSRADCTILHVWFESQHHCDVENLRKGIVDTIFSQESTGKKRTSNFDKWVKGSIPWPEYDPENPRVDVEVTLY
ncbi:hypothetical protein [Deinococcus misasensis]|uniref:hypothetical protein n=1 Tax=Deinococcus misasensis TaxID=392413 RepID=UPI00054E4664|nr:hypothetical protein [Deinococcus misasensis]